MASPRLSPVAGENYCQICGAMGATADLEFQQNIGMVVARKTATAKGKMCKRCAWAYFKSYTLTTFFLGWWGTISLFVTPVFLFTNVVNMFKARGLADPIGAPTQPIEAGSGNPVMKLIYGAAIVAIIVGIVAYNNVGMVEKVAPGLNAKLHNGEVTEDSDAEYAGTKYFQDVQAINADTKSKDWPGLRKEILARKNFFDDLGYQNQRLQAAMAKERAAGKQERCEQLALDELGPAMNDYAAATQQFYQLMEANAEPSAATNQKLDTIGNSQEESMKRIQDHLKKSQASGCK